jgi:hypothetical protein
LLSEKISIALAPGRDAEARALADSLGSLARPALSAGADFARTPLAWVAAIKGDRASALAQPERVGRGALYGGEPINAIAWAPFHCQKSAVFGLLGLVDSLLPALRTCVDGVWSTPAWFMAREPELARVKRDPRVAALLEELWAERKSVLRP